MLGYNELEKLDYQHMSQSELLKALKDLEALYNAICEEEPHDTADEAIIIEWEERLERIDDLMDDIRDKLEEFK